jgi:transmembrane sensor
MASDTPQSPLQQASRWYAELSDESAGPELWQRFLAWERQPENADAFRQVERAMETLDRSRFETRRPSRWWAVAGIAAAVLLGAVLILPRSGDVPVVPAAVAPDVYATAVGEQRTVALTDGSQVRLNTASRIEVVYSESVRQVTLSEGQALFEVARGPRPFVVAAGGSETKALGTLFEVSLPPEGVRVTLVEGLVQVAAGEAGQVLLSPGEQLSVRGGDVSVARVDARQVTAWQGGMIPFTDVTLADAAAEMNRYSEIKLRIDQRLAEERLSGSFRAGDQEGFAAAMEVFLPVRVERADAEIRIVPAGG